MMGCLHYSLAERPSLGTALVRVSWSHGIRISYLVCSFSAFGGGFASLHGRIISPAYIVFCILWRVLKYQKGKETNSNMDKKQKKAEEERIQGQDADWARRNLVRWGNDAMMPGQIGCYLELETFRRSRNIFHTQRNSFIPFTHLAVGALLFISDCTYSYISLRSSGEVQGRQRSVSRNTHRERDMFDMGQASPIQP
jgi:hypothetical protein